ncbi:MAG: leucine-rich repeat domain-containing protein [Symploca sp. SIO2E6]|nr:leucine-rich repeat domain-containing protein [Symploca sp. SIO2E6]
MVPKSHRAKPIHHKGFKGRLRLVTRTLGFRPLSGLTQLQQLDLSRNQVTDISPLSGLTQLQQLDLSRTQVTDVFPLSGLTQLKVLFLNKIQVTDVSPLKHLPSLTIHTNDDDNIEQWRAIGMNVEQYSRFMWLLENL